jgi:hypothetical protein
MATEFRHADGTLVAHRRAGSREQGCVIALMPGAGDVTMDTPLWGDDGSIETLRTLADNWASAGGVCIIHGQHKRIKGKCMGGYWRGEPCSAE